METIEISTNANELFEKITQLEKLVKEINSFKIKTKSKKIKAT